MNWTGIMAIYLHEMDRMRRTTVQSIFSPVISSSLYFVVFGAAIGSRIPVIEDISYGCLLYTSPSPRDGHQSRMPSSA